jgi:septation ring formation regulator
MYDLTSKDIKVIDDVNSNLMSINTDFKDLMLQVKNKSFPYSRITHDIDVLSVRLKDLETSLDTSLKSLGSMYDDEIRAREQLDEIEELLKQCKLRIRSYKLPIITDNYFVELAEANESIIEIVKELEKKPIAIKTLNIRVDTARDLVLKLYNTTNEMIKTAQLAEMAIMYGNRFRSSYKDVGQGLSNAEKLFFKGNYKQALTISINTIDLVEPGIHKKLLNIYGRKN